MLADPNYARDRLMEPLVISEAYEREERERRERRSRLLRRLIPFVRG
jgi:hypothetical protein